MWISWSVVTILGSIVFLNKKLKVSKIAAGYFSLFYNDKNKVKKISFVEIIIIFIMPLIISVILVWSIKIDILVISELLTIISILSGLMFSLLPLIISIKKTSNDKYNLVVKETFNAVSFEILIGIMILFLLILCKISSGIFEKVMNNITLYFLFIYITTLFLILKRFVIIFEYDREN
jgi:hypothetical protein